VTTTDDAIVLSDIPLDPVRYDQPPGRSGLPFVTHRRLVALDEHLVTVERLSDGRRVIPTDDYFGLPHELRRRIVWA